MIFDYRKNIRDMNLDYHVKRSLTSELNLVWQKLREKDYEDKDSETHHLLMKFINTVKVTGKSETHTDRLVKYIEELKVAID